MLLNAALSAFINLLLLGGVPFLTYYLWHRLRHQRGLEETAARAGLQRSDARYLAYSAAFALATVAILVLWPPPLAPFTRAGSPQQSFVGLGLHWPAVPLALLYGGVKTGFPEELLFRGLIAGSLVRRLPLRWANLAQAVIFLLPHLLVLRVMPELSGILPVVFGAALVLGWVRIKSGSILGPWLIHAAANITICLSVAVRSSV
jgi:membrane protease YdiL (CAAX protease family)